MLKNKTILVLSVFVILTGYIFRDYLFADKVPFPGNLLVTIYSPWKDYPIEGYPNGPPNKPIGFDNLKLFYPYRKFTIEQLKNGQWPLWNPYAFSGNVHLATYQSAVFYPLNFIYFLLPLIDAWSVLVIIQPILAGFFTYLFLKQIKLSVRASFFGAVVFAFSGWMLAWSEESLIIEHSALWLPLLLYCVEKIFKKFTWKSMVLFIFVAVSSILAGFLQMTLYVFITTAFWIVFRWWNTGEKSLNKLYPFALVLFASIFLSSVHLLPALEAYFFSPRGIVDAKFLFDDFLIKPWRLITLLVPDFWGNPGVYNYFADWFYHESVIYIGIPGFVFALLVLLLSKSSRSLRFFRWFTLLTLALGTFPFGWLLYYSRLPILSAITPSRIFFLSTFGLAVLAGYGMDYYLKGQLAISRLVKIFFALILALVIIWSFVIFARLGYLSDPKGNYANVSLRNLVLPTAVTLVTGGLIMLRRFKLLVYGGLISVSLLSSFYFANKYLYFSERRFVFPEVHVLNKLQKISGVNRVWGYGNGYVAKNMLMHYGIQSPEGYDALFPQKYGELLRTQETDGRITEQILRTDADIKRAGEKDSVLDDAYRTRLLSLLGVRYILENKTGQGKEWSTKEKRFPQDKFASAWEDEVYRIWEYKEALPRAFLVYDYKIAESDQEIVDMMFDENTNLSETVVLEEKPRIFTKAQKHENTKTARPFNNLAMEQCNNGTIENRVNIKTYSPNEVQINVETRCPGLLFLSDNYYPGWKAYVYSEGNRGVDGQETKIYRANYSFRAVEVPRGKHQVIFSYKPASFVWGLRISLLTLIIIIVTVVAQLAGPRWGRPTFPAGRQGSATTILIK